MNNLKKINIIARYTFIEVIKSRIMISTVFLGILLIIVSFVGSEFTYGVPERVALDFGMGMLTLSAVGMAIFMGVGLISKEIEMRTAHMILSRPVQRWNFLIGRLIGMSSVLLLNIILLGFLTISFYLFLGGEFSSLLIWSLFFAFLESLIILLVVVLFSLVTNVTVSVIYTIIVYFSGHAIAEVELLRFVENNKVYSILLKFFGIIFPDLSKINIKQHLVYKTPLAFDYLCTASLYSIVYCITLVLISIFIFNNKSLD